MKNNLSYTREKPLSRDAAPTEQLQHPHAEIDKMIALLTPLGQKVKLKTGQHIPMTYKGEKVCYLILEGYCSFRHRESDIIFAHAYAPFIIGLAELYIPFNVGFYRSEAEVEAIRVTLSNFEHCMAEDPTCWRTTTIVLSYILQRVFIRDSQISSKNAYSVVRNLLIDLDQQPFYVKEKKAVAKYILERTTLSRSTVMHILSQLQRGKYITLKRGLLLELRELPEGF